jgi:hypothetical protein
VSRLGLVASTVALLLAGCASRRERSAALSAARGPDAAPSPRSASVAEGSPRARATRLALPGAVLRDAPPAPTVVYVPVAVPAGEPCFACGPAGDVGVSSGPGVAVWTGPFAAPGGAVSAGLRSPHGLAAPFVPSATPYAGSFPTGDVLHHRPGLSVGSGVFARGR